MEIIKENNQIIENDIEKIIEYLSKIIENKKCDIKNNNINYIKQIIEEKNRCNLDLILENVLNYYLDKIEHLSKKKNFKNYLIDSTMHNKYKFIYTYMDDVIDNCICLEECENSFEEAEYIGIDLIKKALKINNRILMKPIKIEYIKNYSIPCTIDDSEVENEVWYIIFIIALNYHMLKKINK